MRRGVPPTSGAHRGAPSEPGAKHCGNTNVNHGQGSQGIGCVALDSRFGFPHGRRMFFDRLGLGTEEGDRRLRGGGAGRGVSLGQRRFRGPRD